MFTTGKTSATDFIESIIPHICFIVLKLVFHTQLLLLQIFTHEESNQHSSAMVFLLGHFLASIPFIFLISISSALVFYFLVGLRNEFNLLVYFILNIFMCFLAIEGLIMVVAYIWFEVFSCLLTLVFLHVSCIVGILFGSFSRNIFVGSWDLFLR